MKKQRTYPQPGQTVLHPTYGEVTVVLLDASYANGRGWIVCIFDRIGSFGCYADEVEVKA